MATIKDMTEIFTVMNSLPKQALMLSGEHGVGKSEFVVSWFENQGYRAEVLFVGQMSDAGDLIGLPIERTLDDGTVITDWAKPKWWPRNPEEKVLLFLDEANRAKPEIHQALMDLILNRKLNGDDLPESCRIVSAINPTGDEYNYDVNEMGPAFLDRFNKYDFRPTVEEWIDWAMDNKVNQYVIGFVSKNRDYLDSPQGEAQKSDTVYPSRRSWKRMSDIIEANPSIIDNSDMLKTIALGVIGLDATSSFANFIKSAKNDLYAGTIITDWKKAVEKKVEVMTTMEIVAMNKQIHMWFRENFDENKLHEGLPKTTLRSYIDNLEHYLNTIPMDCMAEFINIMAEKQATEQWPMVIVDTNGGIADRMIDVMTQDM
jgi:hypothetical protein